MNRTIVYLLSAVLLAIGAGTSTMEPVAEASGQELISIFGNEGDAQNNAYYGTGAGANLDGTGYYNALFGYNAGNSATGGDFNTFVGYYAGFSDTTGSNNTFIGTSAGYSNTIGSYNIFIGKNAGNNNTTGFYNVFLGYQAGYNETGSNRLYIDNSNTTTPLIYGEFDNDLIKINGNLEVTRSDGAAKILVEETNASVAPRTLFELKNAGNTKFAIDNTNAGVKWAFTNSGSDFRVSRQGSGVVEMALDNNGNMTIQGNLTQLSSRAAKHDIYAVDAAAVLNKVVALPIARWRYRDDTRGARHLGPMAEDFAAAFGLGATTKGISTLDTSGVALAAIQGLKAQKDAEIAALKQEKDRQIRQLSQRLEQLEKLLLSEKVAAR